MMINMVHVSSIKLAVDYTILSFMYIPHTYDRTGWVGLGRVGSGGIDCKDATSTVLHWQTFSLMSSCNAAIRQAAVLRLVGCRWKSV